MAVLWLLGREKLCWNKLMMVMVLMLMCAMDICEGTRRRDRHDRLRPNRRVDHSGGDSSATEETKDCGAGWEYITRACYRFSTTPLSWEDALLDCQSQGGELLSVSDVGEKNRMRKKLKGFDRKVTWWIGLRKSRTWQWMDEGDFNIRITPWNRRGTYGNRHECAELQSNTQVNDKPCGDSRPFICERHEITPRPVDLTTVPLTSSSTTTPTTTTTTTTTTTPPTTTTTIPTTVLPSSTTDSTSVDTASTTTDSITTTAEPSTTTTAMLTTTSVTEETSSSSPPSTSSSPPLPPSTSVSDDDEDYEEYEDDDEDEYDRGPDDNEEETTIFTTLPPPTTTTETTTTTTTTTTAETTSTSTTSTTTPTTTTTKTTTTSTTTTTEKIDLFSHFSGCYMLEMRSQHRGSDDFLYTFGAQTCPEVEASGITWPETGHNITQTMPCKRGEGVTSFYCGGDPTCWREEPNMDQCASPRFKKILEQAMATVSEEENISVAPEPEETMAMTTELADVTEDNDVTEEDIMATSKVLNSLVVSGAAANVKDKKEVKSIVQNVVTAGSNLVSSNKTRVWSDMAESDKIRSATSLLVAMESATVAMAEEIDEPTTIVTKDENIELELRVVNMSAMAVGEEEEIVYQAEDSDTQFSIPVQTLSHLSKGGLAKVVFMTHYTMGDILEDSSHQDIQDDGGDGEIVKGPVDVAEEKEKKEEKKKDEKKKKEKKKKEAPKLASYILSASIGGSEESVQLPEPISFTMKHIKTIPEGYRSLCSFWSISGSGLGEWSQRGCGVVDTNASQTTCECDHMTNFAVLMAPQAVQLTEMHESLLRLVTIVGCIISCMCLLASWITFTCFTTLQGERNSIHKNLVACLFVAEMLFLTGIDQTQNRLACGVIAGCLHYFFLASFLWMMLEGVHIVLMLVQVFDASRSRLPYYYATAYAPPVLIIAVSAGFYHQGFGTDKYCWLTTERYFIWSFAGPVAAILLANTVILVYAMTMVYRHSEYVFGGKEKTTASGIRSWIQGALALEVLLGLTWMLGFFFLDVQTVAVAYVFTVLNTMQGLFIFLFHCVLNKKARKEYQRVMKVKRRPSTTTGSGSGTHSSTAKNKLTSGPSFNKHSHYLDAPTYHYFGGRA